MSGPSPRLDSLGMLEATLGLPEQIERAAAAAGAVGLPERAGLRSVVVMGMGGSGIGGDVCAAVAGPSCPLPILVSKHYECPAFVGPETLVLAVSFSGATEETIAAASTAAARGAKLVIVAAGGELAGLAGEWGAAHIPVDPAIPMPRAAIGAVSVPLLVVLERLGLAAGMSAQIDSAVAQLRNRRDSLSSTAGSVAAASEPGPSEAVSLGADVVRLAREIGRTLPLVYGGGALGEAAAWRWKGQFNENPKIPAWCNRVPELTHNELAGWAQHGDITRQVFTLLFLRHDYEHPGVGRRFDFVADMCAEVVAGVHTVAAEGDSPLAQLMDLVLMGDLTTLQMAFNEGVDPGPIAVLEDLKRVMRDR